MFDAILSDPELHSIRKEACEENNVDIKFSSNLRKEDYIILKIDDYYNSKNMPDTPPSIDCLIIVKCIENKGFDFYLIELKDINSARRFNSANIKGKFETTIEDFLKNRFAHIFLTDYRLNSLKFYFVSKIYSSLDEETYRKKIARTGLKALKDIKLTFKNRRAFVSSESPNPLISDC